VSRKSTEIRRQEIKQAILEIISEQGLMGLTTRTLSGRIGLTEGALFRHFGSKREMLLAILEDVQRELVDRLRRTARARGPASQRLVEFLCALVQYLTGHRGVTLLLFSEAAHLNDAELREKIRRILAELRRSLVQILADGMKGGEWRKKLPVEDVANLYMGIPLMLNAEMILNPQASRLDIAQLCVGMHRLILQMLGGAEEEMGRETDSRKAAEKLLGRLQEDPAGREEGR